jgi:hypothetical protein
LAYVNLPQSSGFGKIIDNVGKVENKGAEFQLGADIIDNGDLYFALDGQFSINKNKVLKTKDGEPIFSSGGNNDASQTNTVVMEGESLFSFWAKKYLGNDENGYPIYEDISGPEGVPDGEIDGNDDQVVGGSLPDFTYGFSTTLNYKNLSLVTQWSGVGGARINNLVFRRLVGPGIGTNKDRRVWDYYPVIDDIERERSDRFIEAADYLRMANIKLGYQVNTDNISFIDNLNLYVSGQNMITITNYSGFDPEVNSFSGSDARQGVDMAAYPNNRTITFGLSVGF